MSGTWQPVDLGGFRLYLVRVAFPQYDRGSFTGHRSIKELVAAGRSPTDAANRVLATYRGQPIPPDVTGYALNVFQPESWRRDGIPEPEEKERFGVWK